MKAPQIPTAERLLDKKGNGVWAGWHKEFGWVFLDRRNGRNSTKNQPLIFTCAEGWTTFEDDHESWNEPCYVFWRRRIATLRPMEVATAAAALEALCQEFERRSETLRAQEDAIVQGREAERRHVEQEEKRRREEEAERARLEATKRERKRRSEEVSNLCRRLFDRQQANADAIRELINTRAIRALAHFTRVENLESILQRGIVPRAHLEDKHFVWNDAIRADRYLEASCLSISFPNYRMFYLYQCKDKLANWAVLSVATDILVTKPCMFLPSNAASFLSKALAGLDNEHVIGIEGFAAMFAEDVAGLLAELGLGESYTTNPQAEVLVFDVIEPGTFQGVRLLRDDARLADRVRKIVPGLEIKIGGPAFKPRKDWKYWQTQTRAEAFASSSENDKPF